mmetsp:Transcript_50280/g.118983  ORF Transcript_50280/g.118983 Transcript_50280/m.118983 type:complete len:244 (+) Transcript_50280:152-883(+)
MLVRTWRKPFARFRNVVRPRHVLRGLFQDRAHGRKLHPRVDALLVRPPLIKALAHAEQPLEGSDDGVGEHLVPLVVCRVRQPEEVGRRSGRERDGVVEDVLGRQVAPRAVPRILGEGDAAGRDAVREERAEKRRERQQVVRVRHLSSVHDVRDELAERLERHGLHVLHDLPHLEDAVVKVVLLDLGGVVPPGRAVRPSFQNRSVQQAQPEYRLPKQSLVFRHVVEVGVGDRVCRVAPKQVGPR